MSKFAKHQTQANRHECHAAGILCRASETFEHDKRILSFEYKRSNHKIKTTTKVAVLILWSCWSSGSRAEIVEIGKEIEEVIRLKI